MRLTATAPADLLQSSTSAALDARLDRASSAPVALGLSGGGDSAALLHLAAAWCEAAGRPLLALTVDHGLHPDSAAWTRAAGEMARTAGASWRALAWSGPKPAAGLPAAARVARHRLLADATREAGARVLLLAHTADDAREADRMRGAIPSLGRMREWGASPVWPEGRGLAVMRPLLGLRRAELRAWLETTGVGWLDDPANADASHPRIRARRALAGADALSPFPAPSSPPPPIAAADGWGIARLSRAALGALSPDEAGRVLAVALACAAGRDIPVRGQALARLLAALAGGEDVEAVGGGARVQARGDEVGIGRELGRRPPRPLPLDLEPRAWDGRFVACSAQPGWWIAALAGFAARLPDAARRRLHAVPAALRPACPVLLGPAGEVRLSDGAGLEAQALAPARLDFALGRIAREAELWPRGSRTSPSSGTTIAAGAW